MAGPPERTSTLTPVGWPCEYSGPDTTLFSASTVYPGPIRLYVAPYSDSGNQSVWMTTLAGHTPNGSTAAPPAPLRGGALPVAAPADSVPAAPVPGAAEE